MKSSNQNGFTHLAIAAVVAVVAAIGGVGYYVLTKNDSKNTQGDSTSSSSSSSQSADEKAVKTAAKEHFALVYQKKIEEAYKVTCQEFKDLLAYSKFQSNLNTPGFQT